MLKTPRPQFIYRTEEGRYSLAVQCLTCWACKGLIWKVWQHLLQHSGHQVEFFFGWHAWWAQLLEVFKDFKVHQCLFYGNFPCTTNQLDQWKIRWINYKLVINSCYFPEINISGMCVLIVLRRFISKKSRKKKSSCPNQGYKAMQTIQPQKFSNVRNKNNTPVCDYMSAVEPYQVVTNSYSHYRNGQKATRIIMLLNISLLM